MAVEVGGMAPDFELPSHNGNKVKLSDFRGKKKPPFNIADELGDLTFRVIGSDAQAGALMATHHHYDHADADRDINVVFPIDALRALAAEGVIGGEAREHVGYMGYTLQFKRMYEETAPQIAEAIDRKSRADAVVLTGG